MTALLTTDQLAEMLNIAPGTIRNWRTRREGPPAVILGGGLVRYRPQDVADWIASQVEERPGA